MQKEKKKGRSYASMLKKKENEDWRKDIAIEVPIKEVQHKEEEISENYGSTTDVIEDATFETVDNNEEVEEKEDTKEKETTDNPQNEKKLEKERSEKLIEKKTVNTTAIAENNKTNHVNPKDITTAIAENNRLIEKIKNLENDFDLLEKKNERNEFLYSELKEMLISIGINGEWEMLESAKIELSENKKHIQQLEITVKEKDNFINSLKNNLLSGLSQMFEQKQPENILIQENISNVQHDSESNELNKVVKLKKDGKSIKQIANLTNLTVNKVEDIIKIHKENVENVS